MTSTFMRDVRYWAKFVNLAIDNDRDQRDPTLTICRFPSGQEVRSMTSNPDNVRSKRGRVIVDEAAFVRDLKRLIDAAKPLLNWGGQVIAISTQDWEDHYYSALVREAEAGIGGWVLHALDLDEAIAQGLYRKICEVKGDLWTPDREAEWKAELLATARDRAPQEYYRTPRARKVRDGGFFLPEKILASPSALPDSPDSARRFWVLPTAAELAHPDRCKIASALVSRSGDRRTIEDLHTLPYRPGRFEATIAEAVATDPELATQIWQRDPQTGNAIAERLAVARITCAPSNRRLPIGAIAERLATDLHSGAIVVADGIRDRLLSEISAYPDPSAHAAIAAIFHAADRLPSTRRNVPGSPSPSPPRRTSHRSRGVSML